MRRKLIIILVAFSFISSASNAYAIMDLPAKVQSFIEQVKKGLAKTQEYRKKIAETQKGVIQGVGMAKNCVANPFKCDINGLKKLKIDTIEGFNSISGDMEDLFKKKPEELAQNVKDTEYKRGGKDAIQAVYKNRQENNAVTTDNIAILYAKAAVNRQSILNEKDEEIYPKQDNLESINKIILAQDNVELMSNWRLSRILEMRAYMNSGRSVADLTQHTQSAEEEK